MQNLEYRTYWPVLMLYDVDPAWSEESIRERMDEVCQLVEGLKAVGHPVRRALLESADLAAILKKYAPDEIIVFNWCDDLPGIPRSCAMAAQILDQQGFTYTGANYQTLRLSQDKRKIKRLLKSAGIPTPAWQVFKPFHPTTWARFPAIVKPAFEHCSLGITRDSVVQTPAELTWRLNYVFEELLQPAIVEDFIDGREFHVGVIGNGALHVLPPGEIDYSGFHDIRDRLCTYESNFDKNSIAYHLTMPRMACSLSNAEMECLYDRVIRAYKVTHCRDYARMDVRLKDGEFFILDVNHNADVGPETSLALGAQIIGYDYGHFGSFLINLAAQRHRPWHERTTTDRLWQMKGTGTE